MSSDVVLTSALRSNLLSLQNTQSLIDKTQLRLATGLKVNSALDSPSNFFAAQALDNRASDLSRLLDGIGQSIRTIEQADNGVTALTNLVETAQSIASSARDELAASEGEARIVGSVDLSEESDLVVTTGLADGDSFDIITTDADGNQITETITLNDGDTAYSLAAKITNQFADSRNGEVSASVTDDGFFSISSSEGRSFRIQENTNFDTTGFTAIGLGDYFEDEVRGGATLAATTVVAGSTATSISLYEASGDTVDSGDLLTGTYIDGDGNTVFSGFAAADTFDLTLDLGNGNTASLAGAGNFAVTATSTFQDLVDSINLDTNVNQYIEASFDTATGQLSITSISDTVQNVALSVSSAAGGAFSIGLGDTSGNLDPQTIGAGETYDSVFRFNNSTQALDSLAADYNNVRSQIDRLVADASYRGVNLLNGDDLTTFFNENNTSRLTTSGVNFTADGLGLTAASFRSSADIELTAAQSRDALTSVRNFGSTLANNLSIIQTRQDFTEQTINTLQAGADDLTVADQNEEGANLLALQTRQTLGVTSLSLASQSQQAVLRLF